jgi:hypothetical protein
MNALTISYQYRRGHNSPAIRSARSDQTNTTFEVHSTPHFRLQLANRSISDPALLHAPQADSDFSLAASARNPGAPVSDTPQPVAAACPDGDTHAAEAHPPHATASNSSALSGCDQLGPEGPEVGAAVDSRASEGASNHLTGVMDPQTRNSAGAAPTCLQRLIDVVDQDLLLLQAAGTARRRQWFAAIVELVELVALVGVVEEGSQFRAARDGGEGGTAGGGGGGTGPGVDCGVDSEELRRQDQATTQQPSPAARADCVRFGGPRAARLR